MKLKALSNFDYYGQQVHQDSIVDLDIDQAEADRLIKIQAVEAVTEDTKPEPEAKVQQEFANGDTLYKKLATDLRTSYTANDEQITQQVYEEARELHLKNADEEHQRKLQEEAQGANPLPPQSEASDLGTGNPPVPPVLDPGLQPPVPATDPLTGQPTADQVAATLDSLTPPPAH